MMLALRPWLDGIAHGTLRLRLPYGEMLEARGGPGPDASLALHNWRAVRRLLLQGEIGFAEGFVAGDWTTPDLVALLRLGALNTPEIPAADRRHRAPHRLAHAPLAARQYAARQPPQHHQPLRPRQRIFRALARSDPALFLRALRRQRDDARTGAAEQAGAHRRADGPARRRATFWKSAAAGARSPCISPQAGAGASPA